MKVVKPKYYDNYEPKGKEEVRRLIKFGQIYERSLDISNSEVAHIILSQTDPIEFVFVEEAVAEDDQKLLIKLNLKGEELLRMSDIRALFITIAQYREIPFWKRLLLIRKYATIIEEKIKDNTYEETLIKSLYQKIDDKKTLEELENLPKDIETKYFTLNCIMDFKEEFTFSNQSVSIFENWYSFNQYMESDVCDSDTLKNIDDSWKKFIKDKDYIFEHYTVYYLFSYFMQINTQASIITELNLFILYLSLIQYNLEINWFLNEKQLLQIEIEEIISKMAKILEQDKIFEDAIKKENFMNILNDIDCCSFILK